MKRYLMAWGVPWRVAHPLIAIARTEFTRVSLQIWHIGPCPLSPCVILMSTSIPVAVASFSLASLIVVRALLIIYRGQNNPIRFPIISRIHIVWSATENSQLSGSCCLFVPLTRSKRSPWVFSVCSASDFSNPVVSCSWKASLTSGHSSPKPRAIATHASKSSSSSSLTFSALSAYSWKKKMGVNGHSWRCDDILLPQETTA
jgi:hypothetical protein